MRKLLVLAFALFAVATIKAQSLSTADQLAINDRVEEFLGLIEEKEYTEVLDFMYPKIFNHTSKDNMFKVFEMLEQAGIELKFNDMEVLSQKAIPSGDNNQYAFIKYKLDMDLPLSTEDLRGIAPIMVPMLRSNFGDENVEYNRAQNYINVKGEKFLLGIKDPAYREWMFLIYDDSFKSAIAKTIPSDVNMAAQVEMKASMN